MGEIQCPACGHVFAPGKDPEWAAAVRERRLELGMPLTTLAKRLGISVPYASDIERNNRNKPSPGTVMCWEAILAEEERERMDGEIAARFRGRTPTNDHVG